MVSQHSVLDKIIQDESTNPDTIAIIVIELGWRVGKLAPASKKILRGYLTFHEAKRPKDSSAFQEALEALE